MSSVEQIVVESPTKYEATVGFMDVSPAADGVVQILPLQSQVSVLSSVQLSPNRVRENVTYDTLDIFPVFQDNPRYFDDTSPVMSPDSRNIPSSPVALAPSSLSNEVTGLFDSIVGSPVVSLSITDFAVDLTLLSESLMPLPDELLLLPLPVPVRPQVSPGGQPPLGPIASVDPSPVGLSREGPFDAYSEPGDTGGHPLISTELPGVLTG